MGRQWCCTVSCETLTAPGSKETLRHLIASDTSFDHNFVYTYVSLVRVETANVPLFLFQEELHRYAFGGCIEDQHSVDPPPIRRLDAEFRTRIMGKKMVCAEVQAYRRIGYRRVRKCSDYRTKFHYVACKRKHRRNISADLTETMESSGDRFCLQFKGSEYVCVLVELAETEGLGYRVEVLVSPY